MASGIYERFKANLFNKEVDMEADVITVMLMDTNHSFTATNNVVGDVDANELATAGGYTQKTEVLANKAVTQAATMKWDADDSAWTSATFTAYHAVLYNNTHATDDLVCSIDFGEAKTVTAGTFTIQWNVSGIITMA